MDAELKRKWVEALRSGKYRQGQRNLKTPDGAYCCMGVCLDAVCTGAWDGGMYMEDGGRIHGGYLNPDFCGRVGLPRAEVFVLARMNDEEGKTFAQIADHIEANL
jgi:hypothetical protein